MSDSVRCPSCLVTVPREALKNPNRCLDKNCPLKVVKEEKPS